MHRGIGHVVLAIVVQRNDTSSADNFYYFTYLPFTAIAWKLGFKHNSKSGSDGNVQMAYSFHESIKYLKYHLIRRRPGSRHM